MVWGGVCGGGGGRGRGWWGLGVGGVCGWGGGWGGWGGEGGWGGVGVWGGGGGGGGGGWGGRGGAGVGGGGPGNCQRPEEPPRGSAVNLVAVGPGRTPWGRGTGRRDYGAVRDLYPVTCLGRSFTPACMGRGMPRPWSGSRAARSAGRWLVSSPPRGPRESEHRLSCPGHSAGGGFSPLGGNPQRFLEEPAPRCRNSKVIRRRRRPGKGSRFLAEIPSARGVGRGPGSAEPGYRRAATPGPSVETGGVFLGPVGGLSGGRCEHAGGRGKDGHPAWGRGDRESG